MKRSTFINICIFIFFTLLFVNDFFPATALAELLSKKIILVILIILVCINFVFSKGTYSKISKKAYVALTLYTIGLWIVLTLLGGESEIGLSYNSPIFYLIVIVLGFDLLRVYRQWKREEADKNTVK